MGEEKTEALCDHCGQAFSAFLHQMEEHNSKVVCPVCAKKHGLKRPSDSTKTPARKQ